MDEFDQLFSTVTGYQYLDQQIAKTNAKKNEYPHIPLHNNAAELGARQQKPKQNISFGPRTPNGSKIWDTGLTLVATAYKLGVNIFDYMLDRVSGAYQMPSLASLIVIKAGQSQLGMQNLLRHQGYRRIKTRLLPGPVDEAKQREQREFIEQYFKLKAELGPTDRIYTARK